MFNCTSCKHFKVWEKAKRDYRGKVTDWGAWHCDKYGITASAKTFSHYVELKCKGDNNEQSRN